MAKVTFIQADGRRQTIEISTGRSVMEGARQAGIEGILAECGGMCACSTCHCYVLDGWYEKLPPPDEDETGLLDFAWEPKETSRLTCQIKVTDEIDGLELEVPAEQG
jgi:2Fe-2S ferredoxin